MPGFVADRIFLIYLIPQATQQGSGGSSAAGSPTLSTVILSDKMEEKIAAIQLQQEINNYKEDIKDLGEKVDTLKALRALFKHGMAPHVEASNLVAGLIACVGEWPRSVPCARRPAPGALRCTPAPDGAARSGALRSPCRKASAVLRLPARRVRGGQLGARGLLRGN